ncbi:hypothetical protein CAPN004_16370 [Capnocytophaga cynodegmi]|uniref:porin n=1 Tax=Capnocytophaga cynodegmi TaxID=28189 RepID=UPI001AD46FAE|nr:porin [Capnocytophaga cynodegmi]GIM52607.1 hypothetical protein CAPN004_16370 [Capnocytophaga cynodegmi]
MKRIVFLLLGALFSVNSHSQLLKYKFDEQGDTYIQGSFRGQFWMRYVDTNPGTSINGETVNQTLDFSIRRYRIGFQAQINKKLFFFVLMGNNNVNQKTLRSSDIRLLDFLAQYTFSDKFTLGVGKIIFGGSGRFVAFSNGSMLNLDPAVHQLFTLNHYDDVGRNLGIYAKGQLGKFDYNISLQSPTSPTENQVKEFGYSRNIARFYTSSYIKYEFLDNESNKTPYSGGVGTYIGTKRILNLGIGYAYQPKMLQKQSNNSVVYDNYRNLGIDLFLDMPISERNAAITGYLGYNNINLGDDYVRNIGTNSIFDASGSSFNGGGSAFPVVGTGNSIFLQLGYLLPKSEKHKVRFQPNIGWKCANFDGLNQSVNSYALGFNAYFNGHKSKLSFGYHNRPIFDKVDKKVSSRRGMYVLQYQIEL